MAFPVVTTKGTTYDSTADVTSHVVDLPNSIVSGDLLLVLFACDSTPTITWPAGWTSIYDLPGDGTVKASARYRIATGSDGTSITITTSAAEGAVAFSWRITNWHGTTPPEATTVLSGVTGNTNPNPPSETASWGSADNLWISFYTSNGSADVTVYPTSYSGDNEFKNCTTVGSKIGSGVCSRSLAAATEDPGTFTIDSIREWIAATIVVRPAVAAVSRPQRSRVLSPRISIPSRAVYA